MKPKAALLVLLCWLPAAADIPEGIAAFRARRFADAEREFRSMLTRSPGDRTATLYLAETLIALDRVSDALAVLSQAGQKSTDPELQFQAGRILRNLADLRLAELRRSAPASAEVCELTGRNLELAGKLPEALAQYRLAIEKDPGRAGMRFAIGNLLWRSRDLEGAARELRLELAANPYHGRANLLLGQVLLAGSKPAEALPLLERAKAVLSDDPATRRELGKVYRQLRRNSEAQVEWEAVVNRNPNDDQAHFLLGTLYRDLGQAAAAQRELKKHRELLERRRKAAESR